MTHANQGNLQSDLVQLRRALMDAGYKCFFSDREVVFRVDGPEGGVVSVRPYVGNRPYVGKTIVHVEDHNGVSLATTRVSNHQQVIGAWAMGLDILGWG